MKIEDTKILYINAMGPTTTSQMGGIFVSQRIKALKQLNMNIEAVSLYIKYSPITKLLLKLRRVGLAGEPMNGQLGIDYKIEKICFNLVETFISRTRPNVLKKKIYKKLLKIIENIETVDLIHLHWLWPIGLGVEEVFLKKGIPYVITCHGSEINIAMKNKYLNPYMLSILENAAKVEFVSHALLDAALESGYSGKNAVVCYNGIDTEIFQSKTCFEKEKLKEKKVVAFVGNLVKVKGADYLPKIFNGIYDKYKNVEFIVVGSGELLPVLKEEMKLLPVDFTGQLSAEKLAEEYRKMDVLLIPSRAEGYGCVIKEAQACGVVPIGRNVGGISEAVEGNGILVFNFNDENLMIEDFVNRTVEYLREEITIDKIEMVEKASGASWKERQKKSVAIYREILESRK